jgi:glycosyltransferase involved in cell wall biosynthesis
MRIALVHEFLNQLGGAERVLQNFLEIWPDAEVHVLLYNKDKTHNEFERYKKKVSYLNVIPGIKQHPRLFLALMPGAIESFRFDDYDLVFSDSSSFAKGVKTDKLHICYCHTPTRFLWTEPEYLNSQKYPGIFKGLGKLLLPRLKKWDFAAAQRPNFFIANSVNVQNRIKKYYQRDSVVIFAPVDTDFFTPVSAKQNYFFTASRLEPYKKIETVIEAFNELDKTLKIAGTGTDLERLKAMAGANIEFLGRVTDEELRKYYSEAQAFIFPAEEDAGIMPLEAQACGTPVVALGKGGALETIKQGITGEFFSEQSAESLRAVVNNFDSSKYNSQTIRTHALQFDKKIFQKKIKEFIEEKYQDWKN